MNDFENKSFLQKNIVWLVSLAAIIIVGLLLFKGWDQVVNNEIDGMVTITGNFSCLPLKGGSADPEGCELGVRSRDGSFYALDISRIQDANMDLKAEDTIAVTGTLAPASDIAASEWTQYEIERIIKVNTLLRTR